MDIINDEQRVALGRQMLAAHCTAGGTCSVVLFKAEDEDEEGFFGPVTVLATGVRLAGLVKEVGAPDHEGVFYQGWLGKEEAQCLAIALNARLVTE